MEENDGLALGGSSRDGKVDIIVLTGREVAYAEKEKIRVELGVCI